MSGGRNGSRGMGVLALAGLLAVTGGTSACNGETPPPPPPVKPDPAPVPEPPPAPAGRAGGEEPLPTLLMVQAQFVGGKPGAAKMTFLRTNGKEWFTTEVVEDPDSNVFHKAMPWRDGILTIGAENAVLKHWTRKDGAWVGKKLWEKSWGGKFDRLRDVEVGDLDGDGKDEIVLVTHDMGVVAVGDEADDGTWTFQEMDQKEDTFVHEVEIGDLDGDGKKEFYCTPSERNRASGASQPGGVARYDFADGKYVKTSVVEWTESHAKEILVADMDGDGKDELYAAKEGHVVKEEAPAGEGKAKGKAKATTKLVDPAKVVQLSGTKGGKWTEKVSVNLTDEKQCRFLIAEDVDGDGAKEMIAAGMDTGLWSLERQADGTFTAGLIEDDTGGFEHATDVADLDGDGKVEIYAASEKVGTRVLRKYWWDGAAWQKQELMPIVKDHITFNLQHGKF